MDEIADMSLPLQLKLLRELQAGEISRGRAEGSKKVDVRVISTPRTWSPRPQLAGSGWISSPG